MYEFRKSALNLCWKGFGKWNFADQSGHWFTKWTENVILRENSGSLCSFQSPTVLFKSHKMMNEHANVWKWNSKTKKDFMWIKVTTAVGTSRWVLKSNFQKIWRVTSRLIQTKYLVNISKGPNSTVGNTAAHLLSKCKEKTMIELYTKHKLIFWDQNWTKIGPKVFDLLETFCVSKSADLNLQSATVCRNYTFR